MPQLHRRAVLAGALAGAAGTLLAGPGRAFARAAGPVSPLIQAAELKELLSDPGVLVLDCTSPRMYAQAHIPGAVFTDFGKWRVKRDGVPAMLPETAYLEKLIGGLGITPQTYVIVSPAGFSAGDVGVATRIYWTFRTLGHEKVSVLDGGLRYWASQKLPLENRVNRRPPAKYEARFTHRWLATKDDVKKALAEKKPPLIDVRTPGEYYGAIFSPSTGRPGTIPGAINVPQHWFIDSATGRFRTPSQLKKIHDVMGDAGGEAIVFCNTGHRASLGWFARHELLGRPGPMYDGSMVEWGNLKPPQEYPVVARIDLTK